MSRKRGRNGSDARLLILLALLFAAANAPLANATTFTVDSTSDSDDGVCGGFMGDCTLREAINASNFGATADIIDFNIPGAGVRTIVVTTALPNLTRPVTIDGWSQGGASYTGPPLIELNGLNAPANTNGLTITGSCTVQGLIINRFDGNGIALSSAGANTIIGNYIGTSANGSSDLGNGASGISITSRDNIIGGTTAQARNVISGNGEHGILISGSANTGNSVQGNYIGLNAAGTFSLGNTLDGVQVLNLNGTATIGAVTAGAGNVISGNSGNGVAFINSTNCRVLGNLIGTNAAGTLDRGNALSGVSLFNAPGNFIGGTATGSGNLISGNNGHGVVIQTGSDNKVHGNLIGTDGAGTADIGNSNNGVFILNSPDNSVGSPTTGGRNIISGNDSVGLQISGATSTGNTVENNFIGTDINGTAALGNTLEGVQVSGAPDNTIGGTPTTTRNIISANGRNGILLQSNATGNVVAGNFIGTNAAGNVDLGNGQEGVNLSAPNNTIGGTVAGSRNLISGNNANGITIFSNGPGNVVQGNLIGTDASGTADLGNALNGVNVGGNNSSIGGTASGAGNLIFGNDENGIVVNNVATGVALLSNSIFSNTKLGIDLGNNGVTPNDTLDPDTGANNLQNFPILTTAAGSNVIAGTLNSTANTAFTIQFFANNICDPTTNGEGRTFLGFVMATTNTSGNVSFSFPLPSNVDTGNFITSTATDPGNNTSEFSQCLQVTPLEITSVVRLANGTIRMQGFGVPAQLHTIGASDDLSPGSFGPLVPKVSVDATGFWQYDNLPAVGITKRFYRLTFP